MKIELIPEEYKNKIINGHSLNVLKKFPDNLIDCVITSPPYWALRDYGLEPMIWDGDENCQHEWGEIAKCYKKSNNGVSTSSLSTANKGKLLLLNKVNPGDCHFCSKCGAWKGQLGLEPTFDLYLQHLLQIFDEVKRVLKPTGTCWVNLGDSYANLPQKGTSPKSLYLIPFRFAIEMVNRGWILRNAIIWHKPDSMPSSVKDRFTVDFEYVFFFVKSNKTQYWVNSKTGEITNKKPKGTNGEEGKDWEKKECPRCLYPDYENELKRFIQKTGILTGGDGRPRAALKFFNKQKTKILVEQSEQFGSQRARYHEVTANKNCSRCKGTGQIKKSLWQGKDYFFEQQYEPMAEVSVNRFKRVIESEEQYDPDYHKTDKAGMAQSPYEVLVRSSKNLINARGRNMRAVWQIPTQPFKGDHFAVMPEKLVEPMIKAGCPEKVCAICGLPQGKITECINIREVLPKNNKARDERGTGVSDKTTLGGIFKRKEIGYKSCEHNNYIKGIVLDPFMGSGTTALVAKKLNRDYIGIELNPEYIKIAQKRINSIPDNLFTTL